MHSRFSTTNNKDLNILGDLKLVMQAPYKQHCPRNKSIIIIEIRQVSYVQLYTCQNDNKKEENICFYGII